MYLLCEDQLVEVNINNEDNESEEMEFSPKYLENFYVATDRVLNSSLHRDWSSEYLMEELSHDMMG